jgi:hypothetical protein
MDMDIEGDAEAALRLAIATLEAAGAPKMYPTGRGL